MSTVTRRRPGMPTLPRALPRAQRETESGRPPRMKKGAPGVSKRFGRPTTPSRPLDFAILCERYRDTPSDFGFDPRRSAETIAQQLNVSAATVRRRLAEWRTSGFFVGYEVLPHPALWGGRWAARILEFPDPVSQEAAVRPLSLIDGVIQIVPSRNLLLVVYFLESEAESERRLLQLRQIRGPKEVGPEMPFVLRPCNHRMSRSDWRLVQAVRRTPEAPLAALAEGLGQSQKTTSRRLNALLDGAALIFDPILDFSRFPQTLAVVAAFLDSPERSEEVRSTIHALLPHAEQSRGPSTMGVDDRPGSVQFLACARTAAELDAWSSQVARIPGVDHTLLWYEQCSIPVRDWLDTRIERILAAGGSTN